MLIDLTLDGMRTPGISVAVTGLWLMAVLSGCSRQAAEPKDSGSPLRVRLVSAQQYTNIIASVFGADISAAVVAPLPPLPRTDGLLETGAGFIGVTPDELQQIQQAAAGIAAQVVDEQHRDFLIGCKPHAGDAADEACARPFLRKVGRLLFRRPLEPATLDGLVAQAGAAADQLKDFYAGLAVALEGVLISPQTLFIIDTAEPDAQGRGQARLDSFALASRLSFFLWDGPPDEALLDDAESGRLRSAVGLRRAVDRMLASSRLETGVRAFFDDMLAFDDFDALSKDSKKYPVETGATLADAREQTLRTIVDHLLVRKRDYRDLFTTRDTFMSMNLAAVYGVSAANEWAPYRFPEGSDRAGLLTQVSFLAAHAHPARSSPTRRGKALREVFLCQHVPLPPPNVDFSLLENPDPSMRTARERLQVHASNASCAGCHLIMDPMGLALENYDGAGQFRSTEDGATIDTRGELDGTAYSDVGGLNQALRNHPMLPGCLVKRLYSYGTGSPIAMTNDRKIIAYFSRRFAEEGYRLPDLMRDIALSAAFYRVRLEAAPGTVSVEYDSAPSNQIMLSRSEAGESVR